MINMYLCRQCVYSSDCKWCKELETGAYKKDSPINIEYYDCDNYKSALISLANKINDKLPLNPPSKEDEDALLEFINKMNNEVLTSLEIPSEYFNKNEVK